MKPKLGRRMIARTLDAGTPASWAMRCTATSPSPRSSRSPADGGPSKTDSHAGRDWPTSMSTRSAARTPGTAGSPWPCSPPHSCVTAAAEHATGPPPTARSHSPQRDQPPVRHPDHLATARPLAPAPLVRLAKTPPAPRPESATTSGKPANHDNNDLRLDH